VWLIIIACYDQPAHGLGFAHDNRALWVCGTSETKEKTHHLAVCSVVPRSVLETAENPHL
jgi:hypothetical protein